MPKIGTDIKTRFIPPVDAQALCSDATAFTTDATVIGSGYVDIGSSVVGSPSGIGVWFVPKHVSGGTSVTFKLYGDASGTAGSEVLVMTSKTYTVATLEPIFMPIPDNFGYQYVAAGVTTVGAVTGTWTAWVGRNQ